MEEEIQYHEDAQYNLYMRSIAKVNKVDCFKARLKRHEQYAKRQIEEHEERMIVAERAEKEEKEEKEINN